MRRKIIEIIMNIDDAQIRVIENMPYFIIKKYKNSIAFLQTQLHQSAHAVKVPFEVIRPPGSRLNTFAQSFYSKKTYERVFQQWVIDWREEHAEALAQGKPGLARWRAFSGNLVFLAMMLTHAASTGLRGVVKIWRMTGGG